MDEKKRTVAANGLLLPVLGQGTWHMGDDEYKSETETAAIRLGIELGMNLIDTAEMYGSGRAEQLIGEALHGIRRQDYLLVSKVYPHNASRPNIFRSCDASLKRLKTDYLDIYLLHWRGSVPLEETVECMEMLVKAGKIRRWGVSNFDTSDMKELWRVPNGKNCAVNQVLYHLGSRGIEYSLIPWLREHNNVAVMAYCPLAQGGKLRGVGHIVHKNNTLSAIAAKYDITVMQLLLAFVLRQDNVIAIPKAAHPQHVKENSKVQCIAVTEDDWVEIDKIFPPPQTKMPLDIE